MGERLGNAVFPAEARAHRNRAYQHYAVWLANQEETIWHEKGLSAYTYAYPLFNNGVRATMYSELGYKSPGHTGPFKFAQDFIIPDPRHTPLPIYAPYHGKIIALKQNGFVWGNDKNFTPHLNYVTVEVSKSEFYEFCHIGANTCPLQMGDIVQQGDVIGMTGLNGWTTITDGEPDAHLHMLVGYRTNVHPGFESVEIRFN